MSSESASPPSYLSVENNSWFIYNDSADTAIVFVHGVLSHSRTCWLREDDVPKPVYWPKLITEDKRIPPISVFLGGYYTAIDSGPYEVRNCATELYSGLGLPDLEGRPSVMSRRNIIFVCHSTGGIVVRHMLYQERDAFRDKHIGVVLIASPSYGSRLADRLALISGFYAHAVGAQLQWGSWSLRELDDNFKNLVRRQLIPKLDGIEAYENHFIVHRAFLPDRLLVVDKESAGRYFDEPVLLRNTNHFTAVKPDNFRHPAHELLVVFILKYFTTTLPSVAPSPPTPSPSLASPKPEGLFHYLSLRRIALLYDQLPEAAFQGTNSERFDWMKRASMDGAGNSQSLLPDFVTAQRQLPFVLNYWQTVSPLEDLTEHLEANKPIKFGAFYHCKAELQVDQEHSSDQMLVITCFVSTFTLILTCSKANFAGLSRTGPNQLYEPNSLMPGFFLGHNTMPMTAYVQMERVDDVNRQLHGGALGLLSIPVE